MDRVASRGANSRNVCYIIGTLSLIGAAATGTAAIGYTEASAGYFFLFAAATIGQLLYGLFFLMQPPCYQASTDARGSTTGNGAATASLGLVANVALLGIFIFTRARGVPFGPLAGQALPLRPLGLLFLVTEALLILALTCLLTRNTTRLLEPPS
jgi:hypothetical protein